jgi:hypothetical protein
MQEEMQKLVMTLSNSKSAESVQFKSIVSDHNPLKPFYKLLQLVEPEDQHLKLIKRLLF